MKRICEMRQLVVLLLDYALMGACGTADEHDPHHMQQDPNNLVYFLVLGPILVVVIFYSGLKLMNYLDRRRSAKLNTMKSKQDSGAQVEELFGVHIISGEDNRSHFGASSDDLEKTETAPKE